MVAFRSFVILATRPSGRIFSATVIGTESCYSLFEREKKTEQAKNTKFFFRVTDDSFVYSSHAMPRIYPHLRQFSTETTYSKFSIFCLHSFPLFRISHRSSLYLFRSQRKSYRSVAYLDADLRTYNQATDQFYLHSANI